MKVIKVVAEIVVDGDFCSNKCEYLSIKANTPPWCLLFHENMNSMRLKRVVSKRALRCYECKRVELESEAE